MGEEVRCAPGYFAQRKRAARPLTRGAVCESGGRREAGDGASGGERGDADSRKSEQQGGSQRIFSDERQGSTARTKDVDNPHFRLLFDIYHEYVQNGDPIAAMHEAEPYTAVYHVADAPGRHDPGPGNMKWHDIYKAIGKSGYSGYLTFEYLP